MMQVFLMCFLYIYWQKSLFISAFWHLDFCSWILSSIFLGEDSSSICRLAFSGFFLWHASGYCIILRSCLPLLFLFSLGKQENEFLHEVFGFSPKRKYLNTNEHRMSGGEKVSCPWLCSIILTLCTWLSSFVSPPPLTCYHALTCSIPSTCRECLSLQIRFWTRLGRNHLISSGYYLRLAFLPYERTFPSRWNTWLDNRLLEYNWNVHNYDKFSFKN